MRKCIRTLLALLLVAGFASAQDNVARLTILHWNDFHSQNTPMKVSKKLDDGTRKEYDAGGAAYLKSYLDREKKNAALTLTLHAGDEFQGTPASTVTRGRSQIEILNMLHPDVMTLGNHEFDYGLENLRSLLPMLRFPVISSNIFDNTKGATFLPPYSIQQRGSLKIGILGLAPPDLARLTFRENVRGLEVLDAVKVTKQLVHELRKKQDCNMIVVLSHMGVEEDVRFAEAVDGVDVIIGGHSHTTLTHPKRVNGVIICQAGSKGRTLGRLDLRFDIELGKIVSSDGYLIETINGEVTPDPDVAAAVRALEKEVDQSLSEVIGTLETEWIRGGTRETNVGNWQADVMRSFAGTDIAFQNSGGIRKNMPAGPITLRDIWEITPFGNSFTRFSVTGAQLRSMIEWQHSNAKGELCQVSGIRYMVDRSRPAGSRLQTIEVGGAPLDDQARYTVTTNNYISGHLHDTFGLPEKEITVEPIMPEHVDRDVFIDYIRRHPRVSSRVEGRIIIKGVEGRLWDE